MPVPVMLSLTGDQHQHLHRFLFPGDGKEAVALLLCGRRDGNLRHRLTVQGVFEIPYAACTVRTPSRVTWPPEIIEALLEKAAKHRLSVVKVHSHPSGLAKFSPTDDLGDAQLLPMIRGWVEADIPHGSAIMLPSGEMIGRVLSADRKLELMHAINVVGDDLQFWYAGGDGEPAPGFVASHAQAFDEGTTERLRRLIIAVVGCSGTGSPVIEQLVRLGVGVVVIVDDDSVEDRNLNRILNATMQDALNAKLKTAVQADAIARTGLGTRVIRIDSNLWEPDAILAVAQCDAVFGCMDSIDGRFLLNTVATYYNQAYFDIGVRIDAVPEGHDAGRIREVCGTVHYLQPGRASLMSRGLFTMEQVAAAGLRRADPQAHERQVSDGYITGVQAQRPAVISLNMCAASLAVNELLARLHPYREEVNGNYASVAFSLASMEMIPDLDEGQCEILASKVGIGDTTPLLGLMALAERRAA